MQRLLFAIVAVAVLQACGAPDEPSESAPDPSGAPLVRERDTLLGEVELTRQARPYLALDLAEARLTMMMSGTPLRDYPVLEWRRRTPRLGFIGSRTAPPTGSGVWTTGRVVPQARRVVREILPTDADEEAASVMPPLPEELVPSPSRYTIRFANRFAVEIHVEGGESMGGSWGDRLEVLTGRGVPGLSLAMSAEDAGALYRSLDGDVALVLRGPG